MKSLCFNSSCKYDLTGAWVAAQCRVLKYITLLRKNCILSQGLVPNAYGSELVYPMNITDWVYLSVDNLCKLVLVQCKLFLNYN